MSAKRGRPLGSKKYPDSPSYADGAPVVAVRLSPEVREQVMEAGGAPWVRALILKELEMNKFVVMSVNGADGTGDWQGMNEQQFRVAPRVGEYITLEDKKGIGKAYEVVAVVHPLEPTQTAGDLIVKYIGSDTQMRIRLSEQHRGTPGG